MTAWKKLLAPTAAPGGSNVLSHVSHFSTGTGTSNIAVTEVGFQPKVVIFFGNGRTNTTDAIGGADSFMCIGFATDSTHRAAVAIFDEDAESVTDTDRSGRDDACFIKLTETSSLDGALDLVSMDSDGFTVVPDNGFSIDETVMFLALGGSGISNATVASISAGGSSPQDFTGLGFDPNCLLMTSMLFGNNAVNVSAFLQLGAFDGTNARAVSISQNNGQGTSTLLQNMFDNGVIAKTNAANTATPSFITDGFRLTWASAGANSPFYYLALEIDNVFVGDIDTRTDTTPTAETGVGFEPVGLFMFTTGRASYNNATDDSTSHYYMSFGASDGSNQRAAGYHAEDAAATSVVATALEFDNSYIRHNDSLIGTLSISSLDSDGFTFVMTDADDAAYKLPYIAFG